MSIILIRWRGGRSLWGLPKEMAQFDWETPSSVTVRQGDRTLCHLKSHWNLAGIAHPIQAPAFSLLNAQLVQFSGQGNLKWHWAGVKVQIPTESPIATLGLGQPFATLRLSALDLSVNAPWGV
ncbi:MAG: acetoacetate decarboxylase family protein [Leptolyngbyaceae cyanobacterium CSU_1_4]|nr:acetoacetate decarboxylase family protein [Leptolyngbyaceae cyanobacterium CSU_1_4]